MNTICLNIAGISFRIDSQFPLKMVENFYPFQTEFEKEPDEFYEINLVDTFPVMPEPETWRYGAGMTEFDDHTVILHRIGSYHEPYLMESLLSQGKRLISYLTSSNEQPVSIDQLFNNIHIEDIFRRYGVMILHSSFVCWQNCAILFSAPSGTGKSTQAELWERCMGSETINGDRSALKKTGIIWSAYGLPYAGSSGIFRNESAPIKAIVMLSQGKANTIKALRPVEAFRKILPEVSLHRSDPEFMDWGVHQIVDLLNSVPCYHLSCKPDKGAVELLRDTIL